MSRRARHPTPPATGQRPDMAQDECRELSRWLASKPDARRRAREAAADIARARETREGANHGLKTIPPAPR